MRFFWLGLGALAAAIALVLLFGSAFWKLIFVTAGVYAMIVLGLNLLTGYCGQISFGHNAFFAVGGYAAALGTTRFHLSPLASMLIGVLIVVVLACLVGYPVLRLRGHYLAMATLAFGLATYAFVAHSSITKGFMGIAGIPRFQLFGFIAQSREQALLLVWSFVALALISLWVVSRSRIGAILNAIKDDEDLAVSCGVNTHTIKVLVFAASAVYAAVAGSLYAFSVSYVSPELFGLHTVSMLFIMLFVGGLKNIWGSVVAAVVLILAPQEFSWLEAWYPSVFGIAILLLLVLDPKARLAGWLQTKGVGH